MNKMQAARIEKENVVEKAKDDKRK